MITDISLVPLIGIAFIVLLIVVVLRMFALPPSFYAHDAERKNIRKKQMEFEHHFRKGKRYFTDEDGEEPAKKMPKKQ